MWMDNYKLTEAGVHSVVNQELTALKDAMQAEHYMDLVGLEPEDKITDDDYYWSDNALGLSKEDLDSMQVRRDVNGPC